MTIQEIEKEMLKVIAPYCLKIQHVMRLQELLSEAQQAKAEDVNEGEFCKHCGGAFDVCGSCNSIN